MAELLLQSSLRAAHFMLPQPGGQRLRILRVFFRVCQACRRSKGGRGSRGGRGPSGAARVDQWSLTSLQQRLVKTGGRLIKHARYYWLLLAESHVTRRLSGAMVRRIAALPSPGKNSRNLSASSRPSSRPARVTPRSASACWRTASESGAPRPAAASDGAHPAGAEPAVRRS